MSIACLHTAATNVALFDAAAPPGVLLEHVVRPDLLARARAAGGLAEALADAAALLVALAAAHDAVLLSCSTIGPAAEGLRVAAPVWRADALLAAQAAQAAQAGGKLCVLVAVESTVAPTRALFAAAAAATGATLTLRLVAGAWKLFERGALSAYAQRIAEAADRAFAEGFPVVALAQASMAPGAALCRAGVPLTVPAACFGRGVPATRSPGSGSRGTASPAFLPA